MIIFHNSFFAKLKELSNKKEFTGIIRSLTCNVWNKKSHHIS
ncbi:hypothetical protein ADICYQ_1508 [Cyclobacterium qasimii M12-11B]|uniref:Uncharacterized protein n=1 Tax=Cyclobacterium qasimii M12-11B TaxID=641524 RepID=S7VHE5_9BACT|nr:hypothetical protein ADICYQ_1508 [Cyclobacterium qasimii M12-11B]